MKKKIINRKIIFVLGLFLINNFLLIYSGILVLPRNVYTTYFNINKSDFEQIVTYVKNNADGAIYLLDELEKGTISDEKAKYSCKKIKNSVLFEDIIGYKDDDIISVRFIINNEIKSINTSLEIKYTESELYDSIGYSGEYMFRTEYDEICNNWYISSESKSKNGG